MKKRIRIFVACSILLNIFIEKNYSQSKEDSMMIANSEKWNIDYKKGTLTLSQQGSAQHFTMNLTKIDSGKTKQKRKDSADVEFSGSGGFNQSKYVTIKKSRLYRLQNGTGENATEALFAVDNESKQKRQTILGKVLSKNDDNTNDLFSDETKISGAIWRNNNSSKWEFELDNISRNQGNDGLPFITLSPVTGFIKDEKDSLFFQPASFNADAVIINAIGDHLGAIKFRRKPFTIWVRKDIDNSLQDAIGVLFGIMIAKKYF